MPPRDNIHLDDILNAAKLAVSFVQNVEERHFDDDILIQSAVIRQIEIMGEATKRLSNVFKSEHPEVPWRKIAGMRDVLIHAYDHVDPQEVWQAVHVSIPDLIAKLEGLLRSAKGD